MKLRLYILAILSVVFLLPANAVLKEDSLSNTLSILRNELTTYHDEFNAKQAASKQVSAMVFQKLMQTMQSSNENALMLYSQRDGYVFDLTYACHEAIEQYREFEKHLIPFTQYVNKSNAEVARFDSLITVLKSMPVMLLNDSAKVDRNVCLALAINTRRMVVENRDQLNEYITYYKMTEARLKNLNDYANKKYTDIQNSIFKNGGDSYPAILSKFGMYISETKESVDEKYTSYKGKHSQWDSHIILFLFLAIIIYAVIAIILNQILVRWLATHLIIKKGMMAGISDWFLAKRTCIILASTAVTFAILLGIVQIFAQQNFIIMASSLLVQFAWLLSVIIISTLLRVKAEQTLKTLYVYLPLLVNGFIVISFRVVLIPNALVNLIFPPILLCCCIWQWFALRKTEGIGKADRGFAYFSQLVFITSLIASGIGYTLLSVQILIWWIMQLTCILTITCLRNWYKKFAEKRKLAERPVTETWYHNAIYWVLLPTAAVFSIVLSLYWAADVFNLSDLTWKLFTKDFVDTPNFKTSIFGLSLVVIMWFIANYINHTSKAFVKLYLDEHDHGNADQRFMMVKNVMQVLIWGVWFLISLASLHVSTSWIAVIGAGLSTGLGFASKDILENIYYGISLMTGRIKIGDLIVCDGIRGTVSSISYTSTLINTTDGSVIAFTNSQLFTKNYKNMTRNHGYEMHVLDVGVAYGTDVKKAKKLIVETVNKLDCINHKKGCSVVLKELGDSALILKVIVWVNVFTAYGDDGKVLEAIYETLNENNIEIPFPQTDVHIIPNESLDFEK